MRPIPAALRTKLQNRFKGASTDSEPSMRMVATQRAINTLLTEAIHEDVTAAYGDVTVCQPSEDTISCAFAACIDSGVATVYQRRFPASMDYRWQKVFELGAATDIAIEHDGSWSLDDTHVWYFLQTEFTPYIFTVEDGDLYVQHWNDTATRTLLAEDVSSISACKGWTNCMDAEDDQGLVIGYLRDGAVYYRSYAYSSIAGKKIWGTEQQVESLGANNSNLSVIRTNDFRLGFMTEQSGTIKLALTKRTYPGQSVPPEKIGIRVSSTTMSLNAIVSPNGYETEHISTRSPHAFLMLDDDDHRLTITGTERIYTEPEGGNEYCSGIKVFLDRALSGQIPSAFISGSSLSTSRMTVSSITYDSAAHALVCSFAWKSSETPDRHAAAFTITLPVCYDLTYDAPAGQRWFWESATATVEAVSEQRYAYEPEHITIRISSTAMNNTSVTWKKGYEGGEYITIYVDDTDLAYEPVGDIPI